MIQAEPSLTNCISTGAHISTQHSRWGLPAAQHTGTITTLLLLPTLLLTHKPTRPLASLQPWTHLGSHLATVNQHPQGLSLWAALQPLSPQPLGTQGQHLLLPLLESSSLPLSPHFLLPAWHRHHTEVPKGSASCPKEHGNSQPRTSTFHHSSICSRTFSSPSRSSSTSEGDTNTEHCCTLPPSSQTGSQVAKNTRVLLKTSKLLRYLLLPRAPRDCFTDNTIQNLKCHQDLTCNHSQTSPLFNTNGHKTNQTNSRLLLILNHL